jgi:hypothetical protein
MGEGHSYRVFGWCERGEVRRVGGAGWPVGSGAVVGVGPVRVDHGCGRCPTGGSAMRGWPMARPHRWGVGERVERDRAGRGRRHPGAPGSGEGHGTTARRAVDRYLHDDVDGHPAFRSVWLRMAAMIHQSGRPVVLCGTVVPPEFGPAGAGVLLRHPLPRPGRRAGALRTRLRAAGVAWDEPRTAEMLEFQGRFGEKVPLTTQPGASDEGSWASPARGVGCPGWR